MNFHRNYKGMEIVKRFQNTMKFAIIFKVWNLNYDIDISKSLLQGRKKINKINSDEIVQFREEWCKMLL